MRPLFGDEDALGLFPSPPTDKVSKTGPKTPPDRLLINCNCIKRSPTMRFVKFLQPGDRIFFDVHGSSAFSKTLLAPIKLQWSPRKRCHFVLLTTLHLGKWSSGEPTKSSTPYPNYTGKGLSYYQKSTKTACCKTVSSWYLHAQDATVFVVFWQLVLHKILPTYSPPPRSLLYSSCKSLQHHVLLIVPDKPWKFIIAFLGSFF